MPELPSPCTRAGLILFIGGAMLGTGGGACKPLTPLITSLAHVAGWPTPASRLSLAEGIQGIWTGRSYAYLIVQGSEVVLVDAGSDPQAQALRCALAQKRLRPDAVQAIFLTHGHVDHWAGAASFGHAVVYVGNEDLPMAQGDQLPRAWGARMLTRWAGRPPAPRRLERVLPGSLLTVGALRCDALALPGHTPGSRAYRIQDILFIGDSLHFKGQSVQLWSGFFSESPAYNRTSLARLEEISFQGIADGHSGYRPDGHRLWANWLKTHGLYPASDAKKRAPS